MVEPIRARDVRPVRGLGIVHAMGTAILVLMTGCGPPGGGTPTDLPPPTALQAREDDRAVHLSWTDVEHGRVAGYRVYRADGDGGSFATVRDVDVPEATVDGLENGERYRFAVATVGEDGSTSERTPEVRVSPFGTRPVPLVGFDEVNGVPYAVLDDGSRFQLLLEDDIDGSRGTSDLPTYDPATEEPIASTDLRPLQAGRPDTFTLAAFQTPIRNQGGRGTCQAFAALAAIEAEYVRLGFGTFDLSEQFANHLYRMVGLNAESPTDAVVHENVLGVRGGGNQNALFRRLTTYRIPLESRAPYVGSGSYENPNQAGDDPRIDPSDDDVPQRVYNDWNLQDEATTYQIPTTLTHTPFPRDALWEAPYGITGFARASTTDEHDPNWYKDTLLNGRSIAFGFCMRDTASDDDGVWRPQGDRSANCRGHAVLIIGYDDTDPDDPQFIAKNSWGGSDFLRLDESLITDTYFRAFSSVVTGVSDPGRDAFHPQSALGRWDLVYDGDDALLDIIRLSGFYDASELDGETDRRLGALFDASDAPHRVNGSVDAAARELEFFVDFTSPALDYETLRGTRFTGYLEADEPRILSGTFEPPGASRPYAFYAHKDGRIASVPGGDPAQADAYVGNWEIFGFGEPAYLTIGGVTTSDQFTAWVTTDGGHDAPGTIDRSERSISVSFPDPSGILGSFTGYVHAGDAGTISGGYQRGSGPGGLTLIRTGPGPSVTIDTMGELREGQDVQLGAGIEAFPLEADVEIAWSYRASGETEYTPLRTTVDGETFDASLPCDDLVVLAEATDTMSGLSAMDAEPLSCLPKTETRMWYANRDVSGTVTDVGEVIPAQTANVIYAGDNDFDHAQRGFLTFDWILPDDLASIRRAEVTIYLEAIEGLPYNTLLDLRAVQVDYGATLDDGDFLPTFLPGATTLPFDGSTTTGTLTFDVTDAMKDAWDARATRGDRLQLMLYFRNGTDDDGQADRVTVSAQDTFDTVFLPMLDVTYDNF